MSHRYIKLLVDGEQLDDVYLLGEKQIRVNRNSDLYLLVDLRDKTGGVSARKWNVTEQQCANLVSGQYVRIRGKAQLYQGNLQIILTHIEPVTPEGLDSADFVEQSERDVAALRRRLREILATITDVPLRTLLECYQSDEVLMAAFCACPAGTKAHHAYLGGLIEHVVNMSEVVVRIADLYPKVNRDLWLAGCFLHDLGKTRELSYDNGFAYTDEGQLLGHLVIGVEMLNQQLKRAEEILGEPVPTETVLRLKHMILSHHGSYEYGSPRLPMSPEAIALHHVDNLDAKVHEFLKEIENDQNSSATFSQYNGRLERKIYKGATKPV